LNYYNNGCNCGQNSANRGDDYTSHTGIAYQVDHQKARRGTTVSVY